ncbi:hypothetical protein [Haploplasma axanthum]|uniref:Uncharacterized protein n=1 Tax=Haploplasma axanthum TaxID=29552 RepID=A0A449BBV7_HAPAX|nr:hypothetical protein [Haploplasma axanthum]VEU79925.1 Uncharacterised protein [Haploplasma axanthum]
MEYLLIIITNLGSALFLLYLLQVLFSNKLSTKTTIIIYNVVMIANGIIYYSSTKNLIGTLITLSPYILVELLSLNFKSAFGFNFRQTRFKWKLKREPQIYSQSIMKKKLGFIGIVILLILSIATSILFILNQNDRLYVIAFIVSLVFLIGMIIIASLTSKKYQNDFVILTVGTKNPVMYKFLLKKMSTKEKELFTDENYLVDNVGEIWVRENKKVTIYHNYAFPNDYATYDIKNFEIYDNEMLLNISTQFERYNKKRVDLEVENSNYKVIKETRI